MANLKFNLSPKNRSLLLLLGVCLLPQLVLGYDTGWKSSPEDQSIYFLGLLFGPVGNVLSGAGKQIIGQLFSIFNIAVLSIGSLVVTYTVVATSISTAQEGELMGKKFSSVWIPIRTVSGVAFLLPTKGGYSVLQVLIMTIILQGVHAGNQIYEVLLDNAKEGVSLNVTKEVVSAGDNTLGALGLFKSLVCMEYINTDPNLKAVIGDNEITAYELGNALFFGAPDTSYRKLCGNLSPSDKPTDIESESTWNATQLAAGEAAIAQMQPYAQEAVLLYRENKIESATGSGVIGMGRNAIKSLVANTPTGKSVSKDFAALLDQGKEDGWIFAGSYYFKLIAPIQDQAATPLTAPISEAFDKKNFSTASWKANWTIIENVANDYLEVTDLGRAEAAPRTTINLGASAELKDWAAKIFAPFSDFITEKVTNFVQNLLAPTEGGKDPIVQMSSIGMKIMGATEIAWFLLIAVAFGIALVGCPMSGMQPLCYGILAFISLLSTVVTFMLAVLWTAGVAIGIYTPMIPYIIFTFTAISWLILTIEAMVSAPIVALGLVSPAQDHLGRASPSVILITNVFLRPSLMILGFVAGSRLVIAVIKMLHFGFAGTVQASVSNIGIFGPIALLVLYAGLVIMVVHESFSLIYVIPDKVIRWIGGQAEQSIAAQAEKEVRGYSKKGAEVGKEAMKSAATFASEKAKQKVKESEPGGGGGGTSAI